MLFPLFITLKIPKFEIYVLTRKKWLEREKEKTAMPRRVTKAIAKTPKILNKTLIR